MNTIDTDYLVIGAGATGLAFADTLVRACDAHVTLVDRRGRPGGHWNDAYPFVTLHQPSSFYGVDSLPLGSGRRDADGLNRGLYELATGPELLAYYDEVVRRQLLPTGRVRYLPMHEVREDGDSTRVVSLLTGQETAVQVRRKVVDACAFSPGVPLTHQRRFEVAEDAWCVPPNDLPALWQTRGERPMPRYYVILGAGKTAMDAAIWLLQAGVDPRDLQWVVPRDSWLLNRLHTQPGPDFFAESIGGQADQMMACAQATSTEDLFDRLEACGTLLRIDRRQRPTMFHLATVSVGEVELLRTIDRVVRLGRVRAVAADGMTLERGQVSVPPQTLYVDCTASAVEPRPSAPIFQGRRIVLQLVRLPQPCFSAALTAWVEAHRDDQAVQNRLCGTVPFPYRLADYPRALLAGMRNQFQWGQDAELRRWVRDTRLDGFGKLLSTIDPADGEKQAILARFKASAGAALANLPRLVAAA